MGITAFRRHLTFLVIMVASLASVPSLWARSLAEPVGEEAFKVLMAFYDYDKEISLEARAVELKETATTVRRKVVFRGARGFLVPGYLEFPKQGKPPYPCVLLLHGWSGSKENWWDDGKYISGGEAQTALLAHGYAVFALDAQGHGDRIAENDYSVVNVYNEPGAEPRKNYFTLREIITQSVVDYRRGLDYLVTRGDVDMQRIGLLGYSMGGFQAFALTAAEPRIKVAVACAAPVSWSQDVVLAPANYARGIGDRPFCMLVGRRDEMCSEVQAQELYELAESPNTKILFYDAGHRLPVDYVPDAAAFMAAHL
ncbi:MAG: alpha/beta fold hydrolase [Armatimonadota bacterium]|nr:MAG: alpha/beta fold hydrolase [Armatimonadota bacterium]